MARDLIFLRGVARALWRIRGLSPASSTLVCDDLEAAVDRFSSRTAIVFEGCGVTYAHFDELANRYAHWARERKIRRGEAVALLMPNRIEVLAIWYGLSKVGVITALIDAQLTGQALAQSLMLSGAAHVVTDPETASAFTDVRGGLGRTVIWWSLGAPSSADRDLDKALKGMSALRPDRHSARGGLTAKDDVLYLLTSDDAGGAKATRVTNLKAQVFMRSLAAGIDARQSDRIYDAIPLHHDIGGVGAVGAVLLSGATLVLSRRFCSSQFWAEILAHNCTMFVYGGDLGRLLLAAPPQPSATDHRIRRAFGVGLHGDMAERMAARFKIASLVEVYGTLHGNILLMNFDGWPGAVGRIPHALRRWFNLRLVRVDIKNGEAKRTAAGRLVDCDPGEIGEALGQVAAKPGFGLFAESDLQDVEGDVLRDGAKDAEVWLRSGDLMRQDRDGYLYFVDHLDDSFHWKGEDVSTAAVEACLLKAPAVQDVHVFGVSVPGAEGRAGMAAVVITAGFEVKRLQTVIDAGLPPQARPVFLRLKSQAQSTLKLGRRREETGPEAFNPVIVNDPLYYRPARQDYARLYAVTYQRLMGGMIQL